MPEALETWSVGLMQHVLPRHLQIILRINQEFLDAAALARPGDIGFLRRLSLIDESGERRVRMAHLCVVGSHKVNGVSALHSDLLVKTIFADFASLYPERFINMTNGVTPRRWLAQANPGLAALLDRTPRQRLAARPGRSSPDLVRLRRQRRASAPHSRPSSTSTRSRLAAHVAARSRRDASTRPACSTCRSSASTNTSGSCSTCCMS